MTKQQLNDFMEEFIYKHYQWLLENAKREEIEDRNRREEAVVRTFVAYLQEHKF